ncbi:MAG TPA: hypothetical protein DEF41_10950 [Desulfovibrio sp.]|uniref:Uncharacterized protein n=1 Tax=Nitratidesulfovibrio vulgaris (strain ATCC 29579 / DSM 644 / CCUG 34227 / NCIMB 8303 / VKM B-1760 / Hildenborough) TaxID=882 RepID=Q729R6_NITV2|nr:hypothetical protein DVU_2283 [Nitratidesulfovibrio vulgaris str. Hildenborough]HBW16623.1 hypothetical protein [Desulfovibrio sp.]
MTGLSLPVPPPASLHLCLSVTPQGRFDACGILC